MQPNKRNLIITFSLLIVTSALFRIIPGRPFGFEPMIAMAIFGAAVLKDKKLGFALPLFAMLLSDLMYETLARAGYTNIHGFYHGQWFNYVLIAGMAFIGMAMKKISVLNIVLASLAGPTIFFVLSNTGEWLGVGGFPHPYTIAGWLQTLAAGIPFYKYSLLGCLSFNAFFFCVHAAMKVFDRKLVLA